MAVPTFANDYEVTGDTQNFGASSAPPGLSGTEGLLFFLMLETSQNPVTGFSAPAEMTQELDHYSALVGGQEGHIFVYSLRGITWTGDFTWTTSCWRELWVVAYNGITTSGDFVDIVSAASPVNGTSINWSDTTTKNDTALAFMVRQFNGGSFTGPGTERYDGGGGNETGDYTDTGPATAGATGTKSFTSAGSGQLQVVGAAVYADQVAAGGPTVAWISA